MAGIPDGFNPYKTKQTKPTKRERKEKDQNKQRACLSGSPSSPFVESDPALPVPSLCLLILPLSPPPFPENRRSGPPKEDFCRNKPACCLFLFPSPQHSYLGGLSSLKVLPVLLAPLLVFFFSSLLTRFLRFKPRTPLAPRHRDTEAIPFADTPRTPLT